MKYVPKEEHPTINTQPAETFKDLAVLVAGMILSVLVILFVSIWAIGFLFSSFSPQQERRWLSWMGAMYSGRMIPQDHFIYDVFNKMSVDLDEYKFSLKLSCDTTPNAYALPGGTIIITKGLLKSLDSEQGLAFVLGHEIGHVKNRDHMRGMGRTLVLSFFGYLVGLSDSRLFSFAFSFLDSAYSRSQEAQADDFALNRMTRVYKSLSGASEFFDVVSKTPQAKFEKYFQMISSHPLTEERLEKISHRENQWPEIELTPLPKVSLSCQ